MTFIFEDKSLEKLLKEIDSLLSKIVRFNITHSSLLTFGLDKINMKIFPIISHNHLDNLPYNQFLKDYHIIDTATESDFITEKDMEKFNNSINLTSVSHNVIFSTEELDLSLTRNDLFIYTKPIAIYILFKFKEFLSLNLIKRISFEYNEADNVLNITEIEMFDKFNPITIRQKELYLSESKFNNGYFASNREVYLPKNIVELCLAQGNPLFPNRITQILTKEDNNDIQYEYILSLGEQKIVLSKEFLKAAAKSIQIYFIKETISEIPCLSVLSHVIYNNKVNQYLFYRYYDIDKGDLE